MKMPASHVAVDTTVLKKGQNTEGNWGFLLSILNVVFKLQTKQEDKQMG
jgi:hypothetical protein